MDHNNANSYGHGQGYANGFAHDGYAQEPNGETYNNKGYYADDKYDPELGAPTYPGGLHDPHHPHTHSSAHGKRLSTSSQVAVHEEELADQNPLFRAFKHLFGSNIEVRGIERVPEDERDGTHTIGLMIMWWSVNMVVSTFPIGLLAQAFFNLNFRSAVAANVAFTAIGAACCGFIATLGPQTGLRTIVISRYSVGFVGGGVFALFNILTQLGFSCTAVILGGQTLTNVSNGKLPLEASIVLVGLMGLVLCFVGYNAVHYWERYAWIVQFIFYCCMLGLAGKKGFHTGGELVKQDSGKIYAGGFLSYGGIVFSSAAGWAPIAADFNCRLPATISKWKVFTLTWLGLMIPLVFIETAASAIMTVVDYTAAFEEGDAGGVLQEIFRPWGAGGKFIMTIMSFSIISNLAPNTYSGALSAQTLLPFFQKVPRAIWCVVMFVIYTVAAIAGREHFSEVLSNFLSILGYWVAFFIVVVAEEHFLFRRRIGYDFTAYNDIRRLPIGIAGIIAVCVGIALAIVSMAQVWYIGPLGRVFGPAGGDLGFEMCGVATAIVYPPLRWLELKYVGR